MEEAWRWFGPEDTVTLEQVLQAGATGIVTSLDFIPTGGNLAQQRHRGAQAID